MNSLCRKRILRATTLLLLLTPIGIAEIFCRVWLPFPRGISHTYHASERLFYFHNPGSRGYEVSPIDEFPPSLVEYNQLGFRGAWEEFPSGKPRVFVVGDSFIEGRQVSEPQSVVGLLNQSKSSYFFVNAGCSAYTTTTELILLKEHILQLKPNRVLLFFSFNDYADNGTYHGGFFRHPEVLEGNWRPPKNDLMDGALTWENYSGLISALNAIVNPTQVVFPSVLPPRRLDKSLRGVNRRDEILDSDEKSVRDFTHKGLLRMATILKKAGVSFSVFIIPLPLQVSESEWSSGRRFWYPVEEQHVITSRYYQDRLMSFCHRHSISCVDMLPFFRKEAELEHQLFFDFDGHWSEQGNRLVANIIEAKIFSTRARPVPALSKRGENFVGR